MGKQQELVCPISQYFPRLAINFEHLMCLPELYIAYSIVRSYIYRHVWGITALHIERILRQCISMAALKVGNENENEIATCDSQCEMLHKYTCMYKFIYVCMCV